MGVVCHAERPCCAARGWYFRLRRADVRALEHGVSSHASHAIAAEAAPAAQETVLEEPMRWVMHSADPTGRTAGQYARATVRRLRMRTLVTLGVLAVATALLGRTFGLHSFLFLASEIALLVTIFVISRYVLPLVERHDRGA